MAPLAVGEAAGERPGDARPASALTAAVVGAGTVAKQHLACLSQLSDVEVAAVCDLSPAVAESVAGRFGIPAWFTDHRAMLSDLSLDALRAGSHAIVEKPIVAEASQLESLLAEAESVGRHVIEDYNYVFNPQ